MKAGSRAAGAAAMAVTMTAALLLGAPCARAQGSGGAASHEGDPSGDTNTKPNPGSPLPGGGTTKDLTVPGAGGVADTGLGGSTNGSGNGASSGRTSADTGAAGAPGTGMSVKGPAGQGLDGQGPPSMATPGGSPGKAGSGATAAGTGGK